MEYIHIRDWGKTQHYKQRKPPWIRLYVEILDKYDKDGIIKKFRKLPDSAKITFILLLCLSSRFQNNIPYDDDRELKNMLGVKVLSLKPLLDANYIIIDSINDSMDDSNLTTPFDS